MSAERDAEVFHGVAMQLDARHVDIDLVRELLSIAKKLRSKAAMREHRIEGLVEQIVELGGEPR